MEDSDYYPYEHVRRFDFDPRLLMSAMTDGTFFECVEGIPKGAKFRGFTIHAEKNMLSMFIEHHTFTPVLRTHVCPENPPIVYRTFGGDEIEVFKKFIENARKVKNGEAER